MSFLNSHFGFTSFQLIIKCKSAPLGAAWFTSSVLFTKFQEFSTRKCKNGFQGKWKKILYKYSSFPGIPGTVLYKYVSWDFFVFYFAYIMSCAPCLEDTSKEPTHKGSSTKESYSTRTFISLQWSHL